MAVNFTISKRGKGLSNQASHYHLKPIYDSTVTMDELAVRISKACTLTPADVVACLSALNSEIRYQLQNGQKVELGWLGSFKIATETKAHANPEQCSKKDIRRVKVNYQPTKEFKRYLSNTTDFKIDPKAKMKYAELED